MLFGIETFNRVGADPKVHTPLKNTHIHTHTYRNFYHLSWTRVVECELCKYQWERPLDSTGWCEAGRLPRVKVCFVFPGGSGAKDKLITTRHS